MILILYLFITPIITSIVFGVLYMSKKMALRDSEEIMKNLVMQKKFLEQKNNMLLQKLDELSNSPTIAHTSFWTLSKDDLAELEKIRDAVCCWLSEKYQDTEWIFLKRSLGPYAAQMDPVRIQVRIKGKLLTEYISKKELLEAQTSSHEFLQAHPVLKVQKTDREVFEEWMKDYYPILKQKEINNDLFIPKKDLPEIPMEAFEEFIMQEGTYSSCIATDEGYCLETTSSLSAFTVMEVAGAC